MVIIISLVSFPVITKLLLAKAPVTTQEPGGMGEVPASGLGTVVPAD